MYTDSIKKTALAVSVVSSFITPFMGSSISVALPAIAKDFNIDAVVLSWIATAYLLATGIALVPFGKLADIFGRKKILAIGFICFCISSLFSALSVNAAMLIIFRTIQGIGSGMIFSSGMAILISVYPPQERGKVLGIAVSSVYIGLSSGPFLGGILTLYFSWRSLFAISFILTFIVLYLIFFKLKGEWIEAKGEKFDITGSILYSLALSCIIYSFSDIISKNGIILFVSGFILLILFVRWETYTKFPVFEIKLFQQNRLFLLSNLAAFISYSATFAVTFLMSIYLQYVKSLNSQTAGFILVSQPIMMAVFSPFAGKLSDRIEPRLLASTGMFFTFIGLLLLSVINENTNLVYIVLSLILLGFGFGFFSSPNMNAITSSVDKKFIGLASGAVGTMRVLGQMFSMGISTLIFALFLGKVKITKELIPKLMHSISITLIIFCIICFFGIFISLSRGELRNV